MNYIQEIIKCKEDFSYFCHEYVRVLHPDKGLVSFTLHEFQKNKVFPTFEEKQFVILKKFRQAGLSTLASIYCLWKVLFNVDQRVLMISITDRDSKNLMSMIQRAWDYLPDWMKCETKEFNQHVLKLETQSEIRCGTPKIGRGYSANVIIIDEAAFIPNMYEIWKGIFPVISAAGKNCKVFVISTVNGYGNWYSDTYHDAKDEKNNFYCLNLEYKEHPEYNNDQYVEMMKEQLGPRGFDQEVLGIFLSSGDTFIKPESIVELKNNIESLKEPSKMFNNKLWIWNKPKPKRAYILCADVAEGLGGENDYSAFHILDLVTLDQECEFCDNNISTYEFAKVIDEIGKYYNNAILVIESNSLGEGILQRLYNDLDYENIFWQNSSNKKSKMGFCMSSKNRPLILNNFSNMITNKHVKIKSSRLLNEIQTFEFHKNTGRAEARSGRHDDLIMSLAMGLFARNQIINDVPLEYLSDYKIQEDELELSFNPSYENIISDQEESKQKSKNTNDEGFLFVSHNSTDEEDLLKEFGW